MARVNLSLPDELAELVHHELPDLNVSRVLQDALRALLRCDHRDLVCAQCSAPLPRRLVIDQALSAFLATPCGSSASSSTAAGLSKARPGF
ncbi:MAG: hypothetical protein ACRDZ3_20765 [Acidimicrobiia bacterium]